MLACGWGGDRVTGRRGGITVTTNGLGVSFWGMENVLNLDCDDGCTIIY